MSETAKNETTAAAETPSAEYIADMRGYLRYTSPALDGEIKDLISAARDDLVLGGVLPVWALDETDPLIKRAVGVYVKAEFGLDNSDAEKYRAAYDKLKAALTVSTKYTQETTADTETGA